MEGRVGSDSTAGKEWTWMKIYTSTLTNMADNGAVTVTLGVYDMIIELMSGHYADQACYDFYGATYNNIKAVSPATPVFTKNFAFNSYTLSGVSIGSPANTEKLKISLVNFIMKKLGIGEDGLKTV